MNTCYRQISLFDYILEDLRHLSEQNSNFDNVRRITTENALTDLYIYLFGTKIVETIDTTAVWQAVVTLYRAVSFKAIKQPKKCRQFWGQQYIPTPNKAKQKAKYLTIYSINISLYYNTQQYYQYVSTIQINSRNYLYYTKNLRKTINSRKN